MVAAIGVRELHFQRTIIREFYWRAEAFAGSQLVLAKCRAGIVNDDGGNGLAAGIDELDADHMSAAPGEEGNQQQSETKSLDPHFFSITRAASTAPLRLSCSLRGKTRMFQFQRLFFLGR